MKEKKVRTPLKNGVGNIVLTLYTKPYDCGGGKCLFCFTDDNMPRSSLHHEDSIRARNLNWSPSAQLEEHFKRFA